METREFVQRKNNHFLWTMKIVPEVWWIYQDLGLLNKKRPVLGLYLSKQAGSGLFAKMRPSVASLHWEHLIWQGGSPVCYVAYFMTLLFTA